MWETTTRVSFCLPGPQFVVERFGEGQFRRNDIVSSGLGWTPDASTPLNTHATEDIQR